jgi:pimeloyl-ACP methyl ester carboxylesterase
VRDVTGDGAFGLHYEEAGDGPSLLLLHAFPLDGRMWHSQVASLSAEHRVVVPDMPGFGKGRLPDGTPSIDDLANAIVKHCASIGVDRPIVAGCSMGGYIALAIARLHPKFASGLALVDTRATADSQPSRLARYEMVERARHEGAGFLLQTDPPVSAETSTRRPDAVAFIKSMMADATAAGIMVAQRAMASRKDSRPSLSAIRVPVTVVHGTDDPVVAIAEGQAMAGAIKGSTFVPIRGAGHLSPVETPDEVTAAIRALALRV